MFSALTQTIRVNSMLGVTLRSAQEFMMFRDTTVNAHDKNLRNYRAFISDSNLLLMNTLLCSWRGTIMM